MYACTSVNAATPQNLIVDTDAGFDVDDVGALCLANALEDAGLVKILAVVHNTGCKLGIGGVSAIQHFYGRDNVTLGAWKGAYGSDCNKHYEGTLGQNQYLSTIINDMGGPVKSYDDVPLGTEAYRRVLSDPSVPNASVAIASIGLPTNLRDLLDTKGDSISPLSGKELVAQKVRTIVFMDGGYNFGCTAGNIGPCGDARCDCWASAQVTLENMPPSVSMVFSRAGENPDIYTGGGMQTHHPIQSPCRKAYKDWCCNPNGRRGDFGRLSWDPIAVMIASLGPGSVYEKLTDYGTQVSADPDGKEHFYGQGTRNARTTFNGTDDPAGHIASVINSFLNKPPGGTANWEELAGHNCWGGHGATDLEHPPRSAAGPPMSLVDCQHLCDKLKGCTAITVSSAQGGLVNCYRKTNVVPNECDQGTYFDTYLKPDDEL